ncbi:MAG: diaminopimelate epimerase, partial [bacterium]|nr:diaminopimelate epimerase [bacterium]
MDRLHFTKMEGTGNDFIVVNGLRRETASVVRQAKILCDRRFGIGADQLLLILPSKKADFRMEIINADGSEVEMCGNGVRCFAKYCIDHGLFAGDSMAVETPAGIIRPTVTKNGVTVDMGRPVLNG